MRIHAPKFASIAESKSPVQLVRNAAGGRIPSIVLLSIDDARDESVPWC